MKMITLGKDFIMKLMGIKMQTKILQLNAIKTKMKLF